MNRINDILSRKGRSIVTISPDINTLDALKIMAEKNIGSVVVMQQDEYLGIITERDYSRKVILKGKSSANTTVAEIMSVGLPHITPQDSIEHCMALMTGNNIRYLPVFKDNKLAGIISMSDVVKQIILAQQDTINHLDNYIRQ